MQPQRFDIHKAPLTPLRAEPRHAAPQGGAGHIQGVDATSGGLVRSTLFAGGAALVILTLFYLPAEYGVDPTGVGGLLGLTEMGDIKQQLYGEAAAQDAAATEIATAPEENAEPGDVAARLDRIDAQLQQIAAVIGADIATASVAQAEAMPEAVASIAPVPDAEPAAIGPEAAALPVDAGDAAAWRDEMVFTLAPSEAKEIKLVMAAGDVANFEWVSEGGGVNYTQHGDDGGANEVRFEDGRAAPGQDGTMAAPFAGNHGWFWRNRGEAPVTVTLRVGGVYSQMIEVE
ncbi:hypothetical protein [Cypionkella sp.]|uniref:hypothetical protein n=1 Tax=Cypionkella sp. TaxID=2811411 RepID=UPI0027256960|nr:hypothetical protein [Cypionkella sp.]MDO8984429.1 hypothetical protein [Cypionkella sp.]MDP2048092.1 hypothetical protein [Cypionkella sp.]